MAASDRERLWHRLADWEIAVKDAAADLRAAQAHYDEAVASLAAARDACAAVGIETIEEIPTSHVVSDSTVSN